MEKIHLIDMEKANESQNARNEAVKRCIQSLVHACQCRDANCRRPTCLKMKRVVQHTKLCKRRQTTNCPVCKQLIALCCYHAKHCNLAVCQVPFCSNIRQKLQEQKRSQNRRADMMMRRRIEKLHAASGGSSSSSSSQASSSQPSHQAHSMMPSSSSKVNPHGQNIKPIMTSSQPLMNGPGGMQYQRKHTVMCFA
jgi:E1A/CREB-binding protein